MLVEHLEMVATNAGVSSCCLAMVSNRFVHPDLQILTSTCYLHPDLYGIAKLLKENVKLDVTRSRRQFDQDAHVAEGKHNVASKEMNCGWNKRFES